MTMIINILPFLLCASLVAATLEVRTGLLDRLVQHYKKSFLYDLVHTAPVKAVVSVQPAPPGHIDSPNWDFESVMRLIGLVRESEAPLPLRRKMEELLNSTKQVPSRRYLGMGRLYKARKLAVEKMKRCAGDPKQPGYPKNCPKVLKNSRKFKSRKDSVSRYNIPSFPNPNDLYYDEMISIENFDIKATKNRSYNGTVREKDVIIITNPVEARLPSGNISVSMLRRILEARAEAARKMSSEESSERDESSSNEDSTKMDRSTTDSSPADNETMTEKVDDADTAGPDEATTAGGDEATTGGGEDVTEAPPAEE